MVKKIDINWLYAAFIRAIRTVAQTALGMFTVGAAMDEVQWKYIISVAVVAGIYSILTSVATGLPEISSDGVISIDTSDPTKDVYLLGLDADANTLQSKKFITLKVEPETPASTKDTIGLMQS